MTISPGLSKIKLLHGQRQDTPPLHQRHDRHPCQGPLLYQDGHYLGI
jgi:hypothetical protein